ncbi:MAG TPA: PQQ-dependent sugar dehydrogenase [Candidatus Limnocylindria bacterium]|jgi:putative heme-binding domain-containing protein|nr:PQQ-dependent sugar dehydrogenase [Candidatus Limnocylindria bacterium]
MLSRFLRWVVVGFAVSSLSIRARCASAPAVLSKTDLEAFALKQSGDAIHGEKLFRQDTRLACAKCHSMDGTSSKVGPDLFAVGDKMGRREIVEAILYPSRSIAVGYSASVVATQDGEEHVGVLKDRTADALELMEPDGQRHRYSVRQIRKEYYSEVSLMPESLETALAPQEFTDLVDYLVSLKQPASRSLIAHGMPGEIPTNHLAIRLVPIHPETLKFSHPAWLGQQPGTSDQFLLIEHEPGKIWAVDLARGTKSLFADFGAHLTDGGTRGLVGAVFHPDFARNRLYYVIISQALADGTHSLLLERKASADGWTDSGEPARELLRIKASSNNHYGGGLMFGPEGFLYVGMGDTGPQEDPRGNGQNMLNLAGKMLRIDVNHRDPGLPYAIPTDNPFTKAVGTRPEIWASGLREPWRFSFDAVTKELWVGDVGQDRYEEVDVIQKGKNYGWNVFEGFEPFSNQYRRPKSDYTPPVFAYARKYGPSVTGGYVYRGDRHSDFYGVYIFGDYESKRIWGLRAKDGKLREIRQIGVSPQRIVSFASSSQGVLYLVGYEGTLFQLDFSGLRFE